MSSVNSSPVNQNHLDKNGVLIPDIESCDPVEILELMGYTFGAVAQAYVDRHPDHFNDFMMSLIDDVAEREDMVYDTDTDHEIRQLQEVVERQKNRIAEIEKIGLEDYNSILYLYPKIVEQTKIISQLEEKVEEQKKMIKSNGTSSTQALVDRLCGGGGDGDEVVELSGKVGDVIGGLFPDMEEFSSLLNAGFHIELEKADLKLRRNIHGLEKLLTQGREYDIGGNPDPDQNRRIMFLVEHTLLTTPAGFKWNWNDASIQRDFVLHREEQQRRGSLFIDGKLPFQYQRMNCPALHRAITIFMYGNTEWGKDWRNGINSEGLKI